MYTYKQSVRGTLVHIHPEPNTIRGALVILSFNQSVANLFFLSFRTCFGLNFIDESTVCNGSAELLYLAHIVVAYAEAPLFITKITVQRVVYISSVHFSVYDIAYTQIG